MPVVRLLWCAALLGAFGGNAMPAGQTTESARVAATDLPTTNSFSGYIIAVG
jgi:hypothetical protein